MLDQQAAVGDFKVGRRRRSAAADITPEAILAYLKTLPAKYPGESISMRLVQRDGHMHPSTIIRRFGSFSDALIRAGLSTQRKYHRDPEMMLEQLRRLRDGIGRAPSASEIKWNLSFNARDYGIVFGSVAEALRQIDGQEPAPTAPAPRAGDLPASTARKKSRIFGRDISFRGLRHEPINEQGVVFLFGMVAKELGITVESIQSAFPDCEAKRRLDDGRYVRVDIEFEYQSSNFVRHGHAPSRCDIIVCWTHDWPECPAEIEVIELSRVIAEMEP